MKKLIALDLDGTTLNRHGQLSPFTKATLQAAQAAGHLVVIATGRPDYLSTALYAELGLTSPMINFNGALIHRPNQAWAEEKQVTLTTQTALALRAFKQDFDIRLMVAEGKGFLVPDGAYTDVPFLPDRPKPEVLLDEAGLIQAPISVTLFIEEAARPALEVAIKRRHPTVVAKVWSAWQGPHAALEITGAHTGKGQAVAYVAERYGFAREDVLAFGDDLNDLDMLTYAGVGVAMHNAKKEAKAVADVITQRTHDQDGVAHYLHQYVL